MLQCKVCSGSYSSFKECLRRSVADVSSVTGRITKLSQHVATDAKARPADRGIARRHAFLEAARRVFLDQGYEAASVNDVVRMAGGSLATLYAQFGNKEGLFLAVVQDQYERFTRATVAPANIEHLELEEGLQTIGEQFVRNLLDPDSLAFFRVVVGEGRKFPEQLQRYIVIGSDKIRAMIGRFLKLKGVKVDDPEVAATYLMEMWRSRHHYIALADSNYRLSEAELSAHVSNVVRFFLGCARA